MPTSPPTRGMSRRKFFGHTSVAGAAMLGARTLAAQDSLGANDRLSIGIIGAGNRGSTLMGQIEELAQANKAEITAVCDVWEPNLQRAAAKVKDWWGKTPRTFTRFGDLLHLDQIDAVVIATPDFAHCPILVAALEAGKDAYVEKPMAIEIEMANRALDLARRKQLVVQVGTQRRSEGHYIAAARLLATGVLGKISRVTAAVNFNHQRWARDYSDCKQPDVDWEAYLFNRPKRPFDPRLLRRWHLSKTCTNGISGLWMSHYADAVHMLLEADYPESAVAHGGTYVWEEDREHCDTFHALLDYPQGFLMSWAMGLGNSAGRCSRIHGTRGTLDLSTWTLSPEDEKDKTIKAQTIEPAESLSHMGVWLECLRSRERPNADIQYGHQHAAATIMAAAALHTGRRHRYDTERRTILPG